MRSIPNWLSSNGRIARRRDLLAAGYSDRRIRAALSRGAIFRIRHGWYGTSDLDPTVRRVIRVGGQLTGVAALRMRGLFLPRPDVLEIAVPRNAARLRSPDNHRRRLTRHAPVRVHWVSPVRRRLPPHAWIADDAEALDVILRTAGRELAVAACDGLVRYRNWTAADLDAAFARAPQRVRAWRRLVDGRADSWGETSARLRLADAGVACTPQSVVPGAGPFDLQVSPRVFVEVDGAQHSEDWTGAEPNSFERGHVKDLVVAALGGRVIRIGYPQLLGEWDLCLAAILRAVADDHRSLAFRRKRRRSPRHAAGTTDVVAVSRESPSFSSRHQGTG